MADAVAYTTIVATEGGGSVTFTRRERPHLLFDAGKRPTMLYTTLTDWAASGANNGKDKAFTFAQRIGGAGAAPALV